MKGKGIISVIVSLIVVFVFSACTGQKERDKRKEDLLAIQGKGNHYFIDEEGYIKDNKRVFFSDLIMDKIETDGTVSIPKPDQSQTKRYDVNAKLFKGNVYFAMLYRISEDNKVADVIVGYIEIKSEEIVYYNTQISTKEEYGINLLPIVANDDYYVFRQPREYFRKDVYYIIDVAQERLLEKISDIEPYRSATENDDSIQFNDKTYEIEGNALSCEGETLVIDYEYVLARSGKMQLIDAIIGDYKKSTRADLISYENRLYIVIESVGGGLPFTVGELIPVVFEYDFQTDSFDYIGATDLTRQSEGVYIFGIIPAN